jgi:NAD(P)H dehydrogenase (quinone)
LQILIAYYSFYGHMFQLAKEAAAAVAEVPGAEAVLRRVQEFDFVEKTFAQNDYLRQVSESQKDVPVVTLDDVRSADGYFFGSPTRFGNMAAQMKQLFDTMGGLWMEGALEGKPAGVFTSTGSTHGGQETTLLTMMVPLIHLGAVIVGIPYSTEGLAHTLAAGASPYGASTIAGTRGELQPTDGDRFFVRVQAKRIAQLAIKIRG